MSKAPTKFTDLEKNLELLAEESAEVIGILSEVIKTKSKMIRFGVNTKSPTTGVSHISSLNQEIGDLQAIISILIENDILSEERIAFFKNEKLKKLEKWYTK